VLTNNPAEAFSASRSAAAVSAAIVLSLTAFTPTHAGTVIDPNCVGPAKSFNCAAQCGTAGDPYVRQVPQELGEAEKARLATRDHKWLARCRPVIERDRYGVARYSYAAAGCEFGVGTD
jgi:hypothetical protein